MFVTNGLGSPVAMTVNCEPGAAPNPSCCSDPNAMCVNCAREALSLNVPPSAPPVVNVEPLPAPAWPGPVANAQDFPIVQPSHGGLPEIDWDQVFRQPRQSDVKQHRPDPPKALAVNAPVPLGDVQPLPEFDFGWGSE